MYRSSMNRADRLGAGVFGIVLRAGQVRRADFAFEREDGTAWRHAVSSTSFSSATLILASVTVVQPCLPHAFGTGENASGASMHLNSCSSGESFRLALRRSEASVA